MQKQAYIVLIYGVFILAGGVIGYAQAHSIASLVMGSFFSLALIVSGIGMLKNKSEAFYSSLALSLMLTGFFAYRFFLTLKFMPAGMICLLSLAIFTNLFFARKTKLLKDSVR